MLCQELSKEGFGRLSSLAPDSTLSLSGVPMAHDRSVSMRWTTPPRRHGNASAWLKLNSHFRHGLFSCQSISSGTIWGRCLSAQAFSRTRPRFSPGSALCHIDTGRYRQHSGLHGVNPELGGGVRLHGTPPGILRRDEGISNTTDRTASEN